MAGKKDRSRFTIKFNEHDPAHESVICLLEQQPPHSKAQFIVNSILHYVHCPETPDITQVSLPAGVIDRTMVEKIVSEILEQQGITKKEFIEQTRQKDVRTDNTVETNTIIEKEAFPFKENVQTEERVLQSSMDDTVRAMIASTMSAFRNE